MSVTDIVVPACERRKREDHVSRFNSKQERSTSEDTSLLQNEQGTI